MAILWGLLLALATASPAPLTLEVQPADPRQGGLVVVEVRGVPGGHRVSGRFLDKPLRFFIDARGRVRALAAVPVSAEPGQARVEIQIVPPGGEAIFLHRSLVVRAGEFDEQKLRVNPKFVKPPQQVRPRIERERAALKAVLDAPPTARKWRGSFAWPRRDQICSRFGLHRVFNGETQSRHLGLDIDGSRGSPIRAIGRGRVVMVAERYYSGGTVVIDHGLRLFSMYFHMSSFEVRTGQTVGRDQLIGRVGRSGRATGPHLHLTTKVEDVSFDPLSLLGLELDEAPASAAERGP